MYVVELTKKELDFLMRVTQERVGWDVGYSEGLLSKLERARVV